MRSSEFPSAPACADLGFNQGTWWKYLHLQELSCLGNPGCLVGSRSRRGFSRRDRFSLNWQIALQLWRLYLLRIHVSVMGMCTELNLNSRTLSCRIHVVPLDKLVWTSWTRGRIKGPNHRAGASHPAVCLKARSTDRRCGHRGPGGHRPTSSAPWPGVPQFVGDLH